MDKDMGSWICPYPPNGHSLEAKPMKLPLHLGLQSSSMVGMAPSVDMYATTGFPWVEDAKADRQVKESHGWSYCLPRYRQGLCTETSMVLDEKILPVRVVSSKLPDSSCNETRDASMPNSVPGCAPKRFLVFDHTGDKTTLILSPGIGTPVQCPTSWNPKPNVGFYFNAEGLGIRRDIDCSPSGPNLTEELNEEYRKTDNESEMHEDTDEINALLYSDEESDYTEEDDEETSTGHSPSTMTGYDKQNDWFEEEGMGEVACSVGPTKRLKLSDGVRQIPLIYNTDGSSLKRESSVDYEDDAQSSCGSVGNISKSDDDDDDLSSSLSGKKRSTTEKIRETVNILQSIIPGGKGKNAVMVIDEAICYLRSLKHNAESLGLPYICFLHAHQVRLLLRGLFVDRPKGLDLNNAF